MKKTKDDTNLIVKTHIVSVLNEIRANLIDKMNINTGWHSDERKIALNMILAEVEYAIKTNKADLPKEYLRRIE